MPHRSDEALFAAFQRHRDCHALAVLFHRRADELLRLAVFLAPRPTDAEDLVQGTFLSAIARAETFRDGNRVMSWLCGILTNHARMLRRAERRPRPPAVVMPSEAAIEDPAHAALRSELRHALDQGIAALPEPYRSVLTLHLENGLDSHEISQRLARPPATVRKQMERAIERLRLALPIGLATAIVARTSPAQLAQHAADAARFVDEPVVPATAAAAPPSAAAATWTFAAPASITVAVIVLALVFWTNHGVAANAAPSGPRVPAEPVAAASLQVAPVPVDAAAAPSAERTAVASGSLIVRAIGPDDQPCANERILVVRDDGRALPERLSCDLQRVLVTGRDGCAVFDGLAPGRYDVTVPGAPVRRSADVGSGTSELRLDVGPELHLSGVVVGPGGRGIDGAEVFASESSCRGDVGTVVATTAGDGSFRAAVRLGSGRVFARHPDFGPGAGARPERDRSLRLELEPATGTVEVTVRGDDGAPLAGCYVAIAPRSFGTSFYAPLHARTGDDGRCTLPDPGAREATVLASRPGLAPAAVDLAPDATAIDVHLTAGARVDGRLVDTSGQPLKNRDVVASLADLRSNEPAAPLLARQVTTGDDGSFTFTNLPPGNVQVRVLGDFSPSSGLLSFPCVLAGADVHLDEGAQRRVELRANAFASLRGRLQRPDGSGVAGWQVVAVPDQGTAAHRAFRTRGVVTGADGSFDVGGLAAGERYQLGAFVPGPQRRREHGWPVVTAAATPGGESTVIVVDTSALPRATLRCRVLGPDGKPFPNAELELRAVALQSPSSRSAAADGTAEFGPLAAGDYWLAIVAPGLGTRTLVVNVPDAMRDVDAGTVQLAPAARLCVRVQTDGRSAPAGVRVLAQNELGDKFVTAATDARGFAMLPPLPPGRTHVLVHGAGIAPAHADADAPSGIHWIDVDTTAATTVPVAFTFQLADNPFVLNGPLHVAVHDARGKLVFEDYVGAVTERGRFDATTGLLPGRYRMTARALWGARAQLDLDVGNETMQQITATLRL